jgi:2'-5' RNA ligase
MRQQPTATGYALWLIPAGQTYLHLARKILSLSRRYSTPCFEPHVTLASGINVPEHEALIHSAALASRLEPFEIRLAEIDFLDEYFRCLFVRVMPTDGLINAHQAAKEVFSLGKQPPFMPHLSLMYGNFPIDVKKKIASGPSVDVSFEVSRVHLYSVNGPPADWRQAGTFRLHKRGARVWHKRSTTNVR